MKSVIFFQYPWRLWRRRFEGVCRYAENAGWHVQILEYGRTSPAIRKALDFWKPDGCVVEGGYTELRNFRQSDFKDVPTVFCDANKSKMKAPFSGVSHDSLTTTALAVAELERLGYPELGFVGYIQPRDWSDLRGCEMERRAAAAGAGFHRFQPGRFRDAVEFSSRLRTWLRGIPKPCGILGANDMMADLVLLSCRQELIKVPEEIAVVGIDDDELVCGQARPTLTSVVPDFELSGYLAAEMLDRMMRDPSAPPELAAFGASHVVRRNSTARFKRRDDTVLDAIARVRGGAGVHMTAAEVCRMIGGSRRQAEYRFRRLAGHSIGEEILNARIARAKNLLLRRGVPIESIFEECGYRNSSSLRRAFKKATGVSLREWRGC